ncbi:MAG: aromatic amino acid ammonia-lyase [Bifidobacteriaceae bacterium]|jgi:histidine ammonia-lyase|nr:aromatic amino acid ammonia-lyase [Bifidobacteriaceae bacterium]
MAGCAPVCFDAGPSAIADFARLARGAELRIGADVLARVERGRELAGRLVESARARGEPIYGLSTGVGDLYDQVGAPQDPAGAQMGLLRSHACAVGRPHGQAAVRAIMGAQIKALAQGRSAARPVLIETMAQMLNRGVVPIAPSQGSVGYLTATAHIGLAVFGEGEAWFAGRRLAAAEALAAAGIAGLSPGPREGLALISGTYEISGIGALAAHAARGLVGVADLAAAMSLEALRGNTRGYDARVQSMRPHPGQIETARRLRALLAGSQIVAANRAHRLHDPLSLRCVPQVHGSVRDALDYVETALTTELNAVTDNPVFVVAGEGAEALASLSDADAAGFGGERAGEGAEALALPNGNGHGAPVALALDLLAIAVAEISTMSQARSDRLTNAHVSELPPFLAGGAAGMCGLMIPPYAAAALAAENRALASPATVHTTSTCAGQEDHVSMGTGAAVKARQAVANAERIVAIELLCAAQALEFHRPALPGAATGAAYQLIRDRVPPRDTDRFMAPDVEAVWELVAGGALDRLVERHVAEGGGKNGP